MEKKIVICSGLRTPIGHLAKTLAGVYPEDLMSAVLRELLKRAKFDPRYIDGVMVGWVGQGSHAPNIARIASLKVEEIPEKAHAMTIQANCISSFETICSAARHIMAQEGELYLAGGTESMSLFPYAIRGPRSAKALRSIENVREQWNSLLSDPEVSITDTMVEGLTDPVKKINMAATAEVCAQMLDISREEQDKYAFETFKRCLEAEEKGFYFSHVMPFKQGETTILEKDEYVYLRKNLVAKPGMIEKAPTLFGSSEFSMKDLYDRFGEYIEGKKYSPEVKPTVTLFNSCARSDGAAAVVVTTEELASKLGLEILGFLKSWAYYGINPAHMGLAPAYATDLALSRAKLKFADLNQIELHEAFAATCLSIFKVGKEKFGQNWTAAWESGRLNPNGGSIPLGHPLAATGVRVVLNLLYALKQNPQARYGLATACASGGLGGALIIQKP